MSEPEQKPRPDKKTLDRVSIGIGVLTCIAISATDAVLHHDSVWLQLPVAFTIGMTVYFGSWGVARLCGVGPFGGIDTARRDPATGGRLPPDASLQ